VNVIDVGMRLGYAPIGNAFAKKAKARVTVILVPEDTGEPRILPAKSAKAAGEWEVPFRVAAVGLVLGPEGIDEKKLAGLLQHDPGIVDRLADYAEQHTKVEALIQALSDYEQSAPGTSTLQSALKGFSSQYGVDLPTLDRTKPTEEQAATLLRAVSPNFANTSQSAGNLAQQSGGLAASVAALFFGPPAVLAVGGAALAGNLHSTLFPPADFQSAFTQTAGDGLVLCTGDERRTAKGRLEFVWMMRLTDAEPPSISIAGTPHIPVGSPSKITVHCATVAQLKMLRRAREWRLVSTNVSATVPVQIENTDEADTLTLDLSKTRTRADDYRLETIWDWTTVPVAGRISVRPFADLASVTIPDASRDRLIVNTGTITLDLAGADLEFVNHVEFASLESPKATTTLPLTVPVASAVSQRAEVVIDTSRLHPGPHVLTISQPSGPAQSIALAVHESNPTLTGLPLHANLGEEHQTVHLHGSGLERLERIASVGATWRLLPTATGVHDLHERDAEIRLGPNAGRGTHVPVRFFVKDLHAPIEIPNALLVLDPRPKITGVDISFTGQPEIELRRGEIPSGVPVGFAVHGEGMGVRPMLELKCQSEPARGVTLRSGQHVETGTLDRTAQNTLFLSIDPNSVSASDCSLDATLLNEETGASDPYTLGQTVRLPRIEGFTLSAQTFNGSLYVGTLTGESLELIERTGWTADTGWPVQGIATPVPGRPGKQTLQIALPWPSPSPQAPLFIWLHDEREARRTGARY
jgi:hypothetical protein